MSHARDTRADPHIGDKFTYEQIHIEVIGVTGGAYSGGPQFTLRVINPGVDETTAVAVAPFAQWLTPSEWTYAELAAVSQEKRLGPAPE